VQVYGHVGEIVDAVGRGLQQGGAQVAGDILAGVAAGGTEGVMGTLATRTGRGVVRAVAGAGATDAVARIVDLAQGQGRAIAREGEADNGWAVLRALYLACPGREKALLATELRGLAEEQQATSVDARAFVAAL
jgi:hypothetical protein